MGNKNTNLQVAKRAKDDEFYTTYETVEQEVLHYVVIVVIIILQEK